MMFATYSLVIYFGGNEIINGWTTFNDMLKAFMAILFAGECMYENVWMLRDNLQVRSILLWGGLWTFIQPSSP